MVVVGTTLTIFGFCIYYLLPLALLSLNLELFVNIFFWILMAALIGMVMIAMNVEILAEVWLRTHQRGVPRADTWFPPIETPCVPAAVVGAWCGREACGVKPDRPPRAQPQDDGHVLTRPRLHRVHHRRSEPGDTGRTVRTNAVRRGSHRVSPCVVCALIMHSSEW